MTKYEGYKKSCKAFVFTAFWSRVSYEFPIQRKYVIIRTLTF